MVESTEQPQTIFYKGIMPSEKVLDFFAVPHPVPQCECLCSRKETAAFFFCRRPAGS